MIYQQFNLVRRLRVIDNVLIGRLPHLARLAALGGAGALVRRRPSGAIALRCLDHVGLLDRVWQRTDTLSGRRAAARGDREDPGPGAHASCWPTSRWRASTCCNGRLVMETLRRDRLGGRHHRRRHAPPRGLRAAATPTASSVCKAGGWSSTARRPSSPTPRCSRSSASTRGRCRRRERRVGGRRAGVSARPAPSPRSTPGRRPRRPRAVVDVRPAPGRRCSRWRSSSALAARVIELRPLELLRDVGNIGVFLRGYLNPSFANVGEYAWQCVVTVCIALWGTLLAVVISVPLGLLGARNLRPAPARVLRGPAGHGRAARRERVRLRADVRHRGRPRARSPACWRSASTPAACSASC